MERPVPDSSRMIPIQTNGIHIMNRPNFIVMILQDASAFTFFFCHTTMKLLQDRNALLPVPRCDLIAQEGLCSCAIIPTVTAALNGRMSCFRFCSEALCQGSLTTGRTHSATKQGCYTLHWLELHTQ